eukprot:881417_1
MDLAKLILSIFPSSHDKNALLLGKDHANNNPLQIYLSLFDRTTDCVNVQPVHMQFVAWYLSNLNAQDKLSLICNRNTSNKTALHSRRGKFGIKLFEMLIAECNHSQNISNISEWSMIVRIIMGTIYDPINRLPLIKIIVNNYPTHAEKMRLLTIRDKNTSKNVFDYINPHNDFYGHEDLSVFGYLLSFIDQKDDYKLLIRPAEDGKTLLHRVLLLQRGVKSLKAPLALDKLKAIMNDESISNTLLSLKTDANQSIISSASASMQMFLCNALNMTDWISLIMDAKLRHLRILFGYIHDHENELMPKLLHLRSKETHDTLLMHFLRCVARKRFYIFNWIVSWIKKLEPTEIVSFVTATNLVGDTAFHFVRYSKKNTKYVKDLLALLSTQALKERAILQTNNRGCTPFMLTLRDQNTVGSAYIMWKTIQNTETKLRLMNRNCELAENKMNDNWSDWCKQALRVQNNSLHIDDVELLVPSFYYALKQGNSSFARAIVKKINT